MSIKSKFITTNKFNFSNTTAHLSQHLKKPHRSVSLLPPKPDKSPFTTHKSSEDIDQQRKTKRVPPNFLKSQSLKQESKPTTAFLSPSKVLLEHYNELYECEYKEILNYPEVYFFGKYKTKSTPEFCDNNWYYKSLIGDHLAFRYEIEKLLGHGSFGVVFQCLDHKTKNKVAVKVLRKGKIYEKAGEEENSVLDALKLSGEEDGIVKKLDWFKFRGHFCIVYELLSSDLYRFLKESDFLGMPLGLIKRIATQLLISLKYIHSSGYIHCDLKPENILFKYCNKSSIKIADFGSACAKAACQFDYIQSRYYRSPEVILECGYSEKIDIWSLGCILFELFKGSPLFQGKNELDMLCKIVEVQGHVPDALLSGSKKKRKFYIGRDLLDNNGEKIKPASKPLKRLLGNAEEEFGNFLLECLRIDPEKRISAENALMHPWIKRNKISLKSNYS